MKIDFLAVNGSPMGQTLNTIWAKDGRVGVGGAELYMLTLCEEWHKKGHQVRLYNNPRQAGVGPFEQLPIKAFEPGEDRDVLIGFRTLDHRFEHAKGFKVWLSCDQFATGDFRQYAQMAEKIVCISPCHQNHFAKTYGIFDTVSIDIPVRAGDYTDIAPFIDKVPKRCLFSSVPERGLDELFICWQEIINRVPDASLVVTSDYRLWNQPYPMNDRFRNACFKLKNIQFLGAVPRQRLIEEELKAEIFTYPCTYEELFCISCAEAQYAGAYPITSDAGALATTNMGLIIPGNPKEYEWMDRFVEKVTHYLTHRDDLLMQNEVVHQKAHNRFHPETILSIWEEKVFG